MFRTESGTFSFELENTRHLELLVILHYINRL